MKYAKNSSQAVFAFGRLTANHADLETPRALGPSDLHAGPTAIAVNAAGDAAMVYPVCRDADCQKALVYLAVRKAGSSTISSTRLADGSGPLPRVAAAINTRGDALAVWTQASRVYARIRTAGGTVRDRQTVGTTVRGTHLAPSASLSTHRGEVVGWVSQAVSEGDGGPGTTSVAQARDGSAFTSLKLADLPAGTGRYVSGAGIRVTFDPFGRRLLAWTGFDNDKFTVHTAELHGAANNPSVSLTDPTVASDPAVDTILDDATTNTARRTAPDTAGGRARQRRAERHHDGPGSAARRQHQRLVHARVRLRGHRLRVRRSRHAAARPRARRLGNRGRSGDVVAAGAIGGVAPSAGGARGS